MVVNKSPKDLLPAESLTALCKEQGQSYFSSVFLFLLSLPLQPLELHMQKETHILCFKLANIAH